MFQSLFHYLFHQLVSIFAALFTFFDENYLIRFLVLAQYGYM